MLRGASQVGRVVKNASAGGESDLGSIPGSGRFSGGGDGNPLQCSCLENPISEEPGGYSPQGHKEWGMTERLSTHHVWIV